VGLSSFVLNEDSKLSEDLGESEPCEVEVQGLVTSRGKRPKVASRVIKKRVMDGLGMRRSTRLKKRS
jgi:hypothetical protein